MPPTQSAHPTKIKSKTNTTLLSKSQQSEEIGLRVGAALFGMGIGIALAALLIVPILKDNCVFFTNDCATIQYQKYGNQLLVSDNNTGYKYWYDGQHTIYAYGDNLVGNCPTTTAVDTTGELTDTGLPVANACREWALSCDVLNSDGQCTGEPYCVAYYSDGPCEVYDDTGQCIERGDPPPVNSQYTPQAMAGEQTGSSSAGNLFVPVFAINANTMKLYSNTMCARPYQALPVDLLGSPTHTLSYKLPASVPALDAYQMFDILKHRRVFTPTSQ